MEFRGGINWRNIFGLGESKPRKTPEERLLEWGRHHHWSKKATLVDIQNTIYSHPNLWRGLSEATVVEIAKQIFGGLKKQGAKPE